MTEMIASSAAEASQELLVLRAVPCGAHQEYVDECPDCLTGEQAHELGVEQEVEDLGIVNYWSRDGRKGDLWKKLMRR